MQCLTCCCACVRLCHCSSQESAKAKTQKEVIKTLKELKLHLPAEKRHNNKSSTLNTLKYALRCVKQVEGKVLLFSPSPFPLLLPCVLPLPSTHSVHSRVSVSVCTRKTLRFWERSLTWYHQNVFTSHLRNLYVLQPTRSITSCWWSMTASLLAWMCPPIQSKR